MHLSRLAEELVNWSNPGFGFVTMSDQFSTGSSMMPQKRNPDAAELVRAKIGRIFGAFSSLLITLKGLPLTYSKDMQEDKEVTFMAADALELALKAMTGMIEDLTVNRAAMRAACDAGFLTATDLADWLVQDLGIPFREAHHITGRAVAMAEDAGKDLKDLSLEQYQSIHADIHAGVFDRLTIEASVHSRPVLAAQRPAVSATPLLRQKHAWASHNYFQCAGAVLLKRHDPAPRHIPIRFHGSSAGAQRVRHP